MSTFLVLFLVATSKLFILDGAYPSHSETVRACRFRQPPGSVGEQERAEWVCLQHPVHRYVMMNHCFTLSAGVSNAHGGLS